MIRLRNWFVLGALAVGSLGFVACSSDDDADEMDAGNGGSDAGSDAGNGGSDAGSDAGNGGSDAGSDAGNGGDEVTFLEDIQPILSAKCDTCHTTGGSGQHNGASTYSDTQKNHTGNYAPCSGVTSVAECMLVRIKDGTMPRLVGCTGNPAQDSENADCLTQAEQDLMQAWIDDGTPEGTLAVN